MAAAAFVDWPFFENRHRVLSRDIEQWACERPRTECADVNTESVDCVRALGEAGWLRLCVPAAYGGLDDALDVRSLCIAREALAYRGALLDFAFAMQGLGSGTIALFGSEELRRRYLPAVSAGKSIAAFALSEREAGSDAAALTATARREANEYVIDGEKTWISNAGIADFYVVFARTSDAGAKGLSAFVVDKTTPGFVFMGAIETIAPHPLGTIRFEGARIPAANRIGEEGHGFKMAMATLDVFRSTVGAAALGFARRAFDEAREHVKKRMLFGAPLAALQMTQAKIAEMAVDIDASALLVYRAAWTKDCTGAERVTREAAMAKLYATEAAGRVCDAAVQLFGGRGVTRGEIVEALYRDVRALRIYEGASEIQHVVIARAALEG
ncbi:MAG TPA: acyl-CoA dehydrogenase family protein [Candidatus Baltobacteraceae bacterium]|jgi:acyl-CoA dehydrogenase